MCINTMSKCKKRERVRNNEGFGRKTGLRKACLAVPLLRMNVRHASKGMGNDRCYWRGTSTAQTVRQHKVKGEPLVKTSKGVMKVNAAGCVVWCKER